LNSKREEVIEKYLKWSDYCKKELEYLIKLVSFDRHDDQSFEDHDLMPAKPYDESDSEKN